jgi:hypothetical protein
LKILYSIFKEKMAEWIDTSEKFDKIIMGNIPGSCHHDFLERLKEKLPSMLKVTHLFRLSYQLDVATFLYFFEIIKPTLSNIIQDVDDYTRLIFGNPEIIRRIEHDLYNILPNIIKNISDITHLMLITPQEKIVEILNMIKEKSAKLIKTPDDYLNLMVGVGAEKRLMLFNNLKDILPDILSSIKDDTLQCLLSLHTIDEQKEINKMLLNKRQMISYDELPYKKNLLMANSVFQKSSVERGESKNCNIDKPEYSIVNKI